MSHETQPRNRSLLAGVAIGAVLAALAVTQFKSSSVVTPAQAQITTQAPANMQSFADIIDKVKPAVVSVRVRSENPQTMADEDGNDVPPNMERFFRRFFGEQGPRRMPRNRRTQGQGSGFFISADGYIVTNNHVIDKSDIVDIQTDDGKTYRAKVIGTDPRTDLALLKVDGRTDFPWVKLAAAAPRVGDWVLAVGNPFGLGGTVTAGIVSARGRDIGAGSYDDFLQIDAAVNRGNSGGPTFNLAGEVIGVNTAIVSPTGGNIGIAFAIPAETVQMVVAALRENGTVTRGYLGVQIQPVTPEIQESLNLKNQEGALVGEVQPNLPAAIAGIRARDVIIEVDGQPIKTVRELQRKIAGFRPDATVKIKVIRDGKEQVIDVRLAKLPDQQANANPNSPNANPNPRNRQEEPDPRNRRDRMDRDDDRRGDRMDRPNRQERDMDRRPDRKDDDRMGRIERDNRPMRPDRDDDRPRQNQNDRKEQNLSRLGITVAPARDVDGAGKDGVVVTDVDQSGPAAERGLRTGDVIIEVSGRAVTRVADINDAMSKALAEGKTVVLVRVRSANGTRFVTLPVGKG
jgi:serine protease Do